MLTERYAPEPRASAVLFRQLGEALVARGHAVTVLTQMPTQTAGRVMPRVPRTEQLGGVDVRRVGGWRLLERPVALRALDQLLTAAMFCWKGLSIPAPDVVLVYLPPLPLAIPAAFQKAFRGVPFVLHLHDLHPSAAIELGVVTNGLVIRLARRLESWVYGKASRIVVPAERTRSILLREKGVPRSRVHVIANWADAGTCSLGSRENQFRRSHGLAGRFVVSYAGVMGYAQDLDAVVECARRMEGTKDVVFLFAGEGARAQRWRSLTEGLSNVRFLGWLDPDTYAEALRASDVCLVPLSGSLRIPAIPGKLASIMALGRPVVAIVPPWSDVLPIVEESRCGLGVPPGHPEEIERAIEKLRGDPALAEEMGRNGIRYAREHFDLGSAVIGFENILRMARERPTVEESLISGSEGDAG